MKLSLDIKLPSGDYITREKTFTNQQHADNYAKLILRKWGQKVVGEFNIDTTNTK